MNATPARRLGPQDWLRAGRAALAEAGPEALKAEPLARRLGATKGSFYWHFRDVPAYHAAFLADWETRALDDVRGELTGESGAVARLRRMAQVIASGPATGGALGAEPALRAWARGHDGARATLARVDAARLAEFQGLLSEVGIENPEMARIIYGAAIGMPALDTTQARDDAQALGTLVDLVLALR